MSIGNLCVVSREKRYIHTYIYIFTYEVVAVPTMDQRMKQRMNDLLATIKQKPGQSAIHLIAYCSFYYGVSRKTMKEYMATLTTAGLVRVDGHGKVYPVEDRAKAV